MMPCPLLDRALLFPLFSFALSIVKMIILSTQIYQIVYDLLPAEIKLLILYMESINELSF